MSLLNKEGTVFGTELIGSGPDFILGVSLLASDTITQSRCIVSITNYLILTPPVSEAWNKTRPIPTAVSPHLNAQGRPSEERPLKKLA